MLARMLTLSFTSHLLSCDQQLLVYVSFTALCLYVLHSHPAWNHIFDYFLSLLPFWAQVNLEVDCRSILIGANSRCFMILTAAVMIFT